MMRQIQTSASALGSFSFFKSFGRGQTETIRGQVVFLIFYLFFYIFLFWRDWTHILAESESSVKYAFMQIFLSRLWRRSMNFNNAIYCIQDLENTGKKEKRIKCLIHKSWRTEKVIGKKYQSGPIALRSCHVMSGEANCHARRQTNVLVLLCIWGQFSSPGGLYPEGRFNEGFFALRVWRGLLLVFTLRH